MYENLQTANAVALEGDQGAADVEAEVWLPFDDGVVPEPAKPTTGVITGQV